MIIRIAIGEVHAVFDDEITDTRPTPECMDDYATRLRQQVIATWLALPSEVGSGDERGDTNEL